MFDYVLDLSSNTTQTLFAFPFLLLLLMIVLLVKRSEFECLAILIQNITLVINETKINMDSENEEYIIFLDYFLIF